MKKSRIVTYLVLLVVFLFGAYAAFMYVYTEWKFLPVELLQEPSAAAPHAEWKAPNTLLYLHKVNTPRRSARKEKSYDGYEIDLQTDASGNLWVAHDPAEMKDKIKLSDIFAALKNPGQKAYWLDLKTQLTPEQLDQILLTAKAFRIPKENLLQPNSLTKGNSSCFCNFLTILIKTWATQKPAKKSTETPWKCGKNIARRPYRPALANTRICGRISRKCPKPFTILPPSGPA